MYIELRLEKLWTRSLRRSILAMLMNVYDAIYGLGVGLASPYWLIKPRARRKVLDAFSQRMGHVGQRDLSKPAVMIHAVSVGEINATQALVNALAEARTGLHFIVSTTTDGGFERGTQLYGKRDDVTLIRYPLDFSAAVGRVLDRLQPSVVVLMELEVWPNFLRQAVKRKIPVILVNGRLSGHSQRRYRLIKPIATNMFRKLSALCVQDEENARSFVELGAPKDRVFVTGTMKFDTARVEDRVEGDRDIAAEVGLEPGADKIWICGSTGPGEEQIVLGIYKSLKPTHPDLRLVIVPRKLDRFDEVECLIQREFAVVRRSRHAHRTKDAVVLVDTVGELRKFYSIADVVFVGRTLVDLGSKQHGSDMIEPAALGKAVVVGPLTGNFADAMKAFREAGAVVEVRDEKDLAGEVDRLLKDEKSRNELGRKARDVVVAKKGATEKSVKVVLEQLERTARSRA